MKLLRLIAVFMTITVLLFASMPVTAAPGSGNLSLTHVDLPIELHGTLNNADYEILVPANWNGTLLVYAHGYSADIPDAEALPDIEINGISAKDYLLNEGYAMAGTANKAGGWAVKEGVQNTLALTNYFKGKVGKPARTILLGFSMGSVITLKSIEQYPGIYDGAISGGSLGAGTPANFDLSLGFSLAYDVAFGWPEEWGSVSDVRDDLNFETEVVPVLLTNQAIDPFFAAKLEFIRLVCEFPEAVYAIVGPFGPYSWFFTDMFYATQVRAELESRAGGPVAQNLDQVYSLEPAEIFYLGGLGIDATTLLAEMNATKITASIPARKYVEHYATFTGNLKRPVITIQTSLDEVVREANETKYYELVAVAGADDFLVQVFVDRLGHCNFTGYQMLYTLAAMEYWLNSGNKPVPADPFFPTAVGFIPGFVPPAWPFSP